MAFSATLQSPLPPLFSSCPDTPSVRLRSLIAAYHSYDHVSVIAALELANNNILVGGLRMVYALVYTLILVRIFVEGQER
jgi:hypothetical protein